MRWESGRRSSNVEDRRGSSRGRKTFAGGGLGLIAVVVLGLVFGVDPMMLIQGVNKVAPPSANTKPGPRPAAENQLADFVTVVLADTEDTWHAIFESAGKRYQDPTLVMFTGATESACGHAQSAMGPFYCPADQKLYIDLQFYQDMRTRFGAPGDFAHLPPVLPRPG
jgi:predicted metalloprotease